METNRKKCKVICLRKDSFAVPAIFIGAKGFTSEGTMFFGKNKRNRTNLSMSMYGYKAHQLYILSDDEIKKGDYYIAYGAQQMEVYQCLKSSMSTATAKSIGIEYKPMKIIATTDSSLTLADEYHVYDLLPQPSQAFIEKYCKLGGIDEVMVEYDIDVINELSSGNTPSNTFPKVNSHNEITIHPIKDSWSREELPIEVLKRLIVYVENSPEVQEPVMMEIFKKAKKWIEENL